MSVKILQDARKFVKAKMQSKSRMSRCIDTAILLHEDATGNDVACNDARHPSRISVGDLEDTRIYTLRLRGSASIKSTETSLDHAIVVQVLDDNHVVLMQSWVGMFPVSISITTKAKLVGLTSRLFSKDPQTRARAMNSLTSNMSSHAVRYLYVQDLFNNLASLDETDDIFKLLPASYKKAINVLNGEAIEALVLDRRELPEDYHTVFVEAFTTLRNIGIDKNVMDNLQRAFNLSVTRKKSEPKTSAIPVYVINMKEDTRPVVRNLALYYKLGQSFIRKVCTELKKVEKDVAFAICTLWPHITPKTEVTVKMTEACLSS